MKLGLPTVSHTSTPHCCLSGKRFSSLLSQCGVFPLPVKDAPIREDAELREQCPCVRRNCERCLPQWQRETRNMKQARYRSTFALLTHHFMSFAYMVWIARKPAVMNPWLVWYFPAFSYDDSNRFQTRLRAFATDVLLTERGADPTIGHNNILTGPGSSAGSCMLANRLEK